MQDIGTNLAFADNFLEVRIRSRNLTQKLGNEFVISVNGQLPYLFTLLGDLRCNCDSITTVKIVEVKPTNGGTGQDEETAQLLGIIRKCFSNGNTIKPDTALN
jgi:hypothetical protein